MAIKGKVYIIPDAKSRSWDLFVENQGQEEFGLTHNVFPSASQERDVHDDHQNYGHGLPVRGGKVTSLNFREGDTYNGHKITESSVIRVGVRYHAHKTVAFPKLKGAKAVELDLKDFVWYAGSPESAAGSRTAASMDSYARQARKSVNIDQPKTSLTQKIAALKARAGLGVELEGQAIVEAVPGEAGALSHWTVRFENAGKTAFIGTAAFVDAKDKNEGIGLESMPVPKKGTAAVQRIEAMGNYGVTAKPGAKLRLGIRGYGHAEVALPQGGKVAVNIDDFTVEASKKSEDFFHTEKVAEKRNEKLQQVQFFEDGKAINAELKPITYRGAEALARSTFDPPHLKVKAVKSSDEHPGGGWVVELTSKMPAEDEKGQVGFVSTLKLGRTGWDPQAMPPKKLSEPEETKTWFIPKDIQVGDKVAAAGEELVVGTRGLGWFASIPLPSSGTVDSAKDIELWGFREDQYNRRNLSPEFVDQCKQ